MLVSVGFASASQPTLQMLFTPDPHGCAAAEAGALDLKANLGSITSGSRSAASRLVSGFEPGQVLKLIRTSQSADAGLRQRVALTAVVPTRTSEVLALEYETRVGAMASEEEATFTLPADGQGWALFTSNTGAGAGAYSLTVRCAPARPAVTS